MACQTQCRQIPTGSAPLIKAQTEVVTAENLFPYSLADRDGDGWPEDFLSRPECAGKIKISGAPDDPEAEVELEQTGCGYLDSKNFAVEEGRRYLFAVDLKIENMRFDLSDNQETRGIICFVYSVCGKRNIGGRVFAPGSTGGWVTLMLPFDTARTPQLAKLRIMLRCYNLSGTVHFRRPTVIPLPREILMKTHYIDMDGRIYTESDAMMR
jgi:hypothetical protein